MPDYKLSQLILSSGKKKSIGDIFISQPDSFKEALAGKVFILIEINSDKPQLFALKEFLIDTIDKHYYQNEKIIIRERMPSITVEHIFEAALAKVNKSFSEYLQQEKIRINPKDLNIIAGVIHEDEIHAASSGKNKFLIIHKPKTNDPYADDGESAYKIADIFKKSEEDTYSDEKLFTNIISGKMTERSCFVITNETLPEYISGKELIKIVTTLPPAGAIEQIKNILRDINAYVSFLAIVIKSNTFENLQQNGVAFAVPKEDSVISLQNIESKTEKILMPSGPINLKRFFGNRPKLPFSSPSTKDTPSVLNLKDKIFMKKKGFILSGTADWFKNAANIFFGILVIISKQLKKILRLENWQTVKKNFDIVAFFRRVSFKNKAIFAIALVFIIFFLFNTSKKNEENKKAQQSIELAGLIKEIEQKQTQAEANLLYNNEKGAGAAFAEINLLIERLPQDTEERKAKYQELKDKSNAQLDKIRKITKIDGLKEVTDFKKIDPNVKLSSIILDKDRAFIADSLQGQVFSLDLPNNLVSESSGTTTLASSLRNAVFYNDAAYYLDGNSIRSYDAKSLAVTDISYALPSATEVLALDFFGSNAYLVTKDGNILRLKKNGDKLENSTNWLNKTSEELTKAVDSYIDGNIYILTTDGRILKFLKGEQQPFEMDAVDPPIESASKFIISAETENIYIFEARKGRLAIFDKKGKFKKQLLFNAASELKDFSINESKKTLYLLTEGILYSSSIEI